MPRLQKRLAELEMVMAAPDFWANKDKAKQILDEATAIRGKIQPHGELKAQLDDLHVLAEMIEHEKDEAARGKDEKEFSERLAKFTHAADSFEIATHLGGRHDKANAIFSVHAGAGGTESQDWADMLLRMYRRWAERHEFSNEITEISVGEEAGIRYATMLVTGDYAYGYLKAERGVHRLVRISPFDSNKRRHTSFASVDVIAEVADDVEIELKDADLKIDTFRSSGAGGQHVNKTDSAVRITHLPTGIVVSCQNERSQIKNRATAMKILKARLYERREEEKRSALEKFYGPKGDIAFGSQIRSYVFQPYRMIKDLRTGHQTGDTQSVMDGDLDPFINAWLKAGCPRSRADAMAEEE